MGRQKSPNRGIPIREYPMPGWDKKHKDRHHRGFICGSWAYREYLLCYTLKVEIYFACISLIRWALGPELGKKWLLGIF